MGLEAVFLLGFIVFSGGVGAATFAWVRPVLYGGRPAHRSFKDMLKAYVDWAGILFMALYMTEAALAILETRSVLATTDLVNQVYYAHAYPILIWGTFFFAFHKKFGWKSIFVFFVANGVSGELFNWGFNIMHGTPFPALGADNLYWFHVAADLSTLVIALFILRPKWLIRPWTGWFPLAVLAFGYAYVVSLGYPATIFDGQYYNVTLNIVDLTGLISWPMFFWSSMHL